MLFYMEMAYICRLKFLLLSCIIKVFDITNKNILTRIDKKVYGLANS